MNVRIGKNSVSLDCILESLKLFREQGFVRKGRENGVGGGDGVSAVDGVASVDRVSGVDGVGSGSMDENNNTKIRKSKKKETNYNEDEDDDDEIIEESKCYKRMTTSDSLKDLEKLQQQLNQVIEKKKNKLRRWCWMWRWKYG